MLDANNGWSLDQAIHASRLLEPLSITWLEEPLHWYDDVEGLRQLQTHCPIPLASGEQEQTRFSCRRLLDTGAIRFLQYDCHKYCGPTEALRVAALADAKQVLLAPHHEPQLNGHLMCSIPNGYILETFAHPRRDPFWYELYSAKPEIRRGWLHLRDAPGWGVEYEAGAIAKYGRKLV
jgi:L-alanine-DL-glutamate epimerase-like enolase superfamily enzyme